MSRISLWHFVWISIGLTEFLAAGMSLFFHGRVTTDYLVTGGIVSLLVAGTILALIRQAHVSLQDGEARFRAFMDHGPAVAFLKDEAGRYVYVNQPLVRRFNCTPAEWQGKTDVELLPAEVAQRLRDHDAEVLASNRCSEFIETVPTPGEGPREWLVFKFPVNTSGGRKFVGGMAIDITDRKREEEKLALYREIIAHSNDAIAIIGTQGNYLEQNAAHRSLVGYSDGELLGQTPAIHLGKETFSLIAGDLARNGAYRGEVTSRAKDGRTVDIELSAFAVRDAQNAPVCYVGIKRDITERKRADETREKLIRELQEALGQIRILEGILPICMHCKKIRNERDQWQAMEVYVATHSKAEFSHGICPECLKTHYPRPS
ncbi:MAG: PAS domain-containing protein [Nitrospirota bacterium]